MTGPGREERALAQLLKVARQKLEEREAHLRNLQAARASAATSLDWLEQAVKAEGEAMRANPLAALELSNYLKGADAKRDALAATSRRLHSEEEEVKAEIEASRAEVEKLTRLIDINRRAAERRLERARRMGPGRRRARGA